MELSKLLRSLEPSLIEGEFVFCSIKDAKYGDFAELSPVASFVESEGLTVVLEKDTADRVDWKYESSFRLITLTVHSSLESVGLTAAVAAKLAKLGISANVMAAYFHDHIFVPVKQAEEALEALKEFN